MCKGKVTALILLFLISCDDTQSRLILSYPSTSLYNSAVLVDVLVAQDKECEQMEQGVKSRISFHPHEESPNLGGIDFGQTTFLARVYDATCVNFLVGCAEYMVEQGKNNIVRINLEENDDTGCLASEQCSAGRCVAAQRDAAVADGSVDRDFDASTDDGHQEDARLVDSISVDAAFEDIRVADRAIFDRPVLDAPLLDYLLWDTQREDALTKDTNIPDALSDLVNMPDVNIPDVNMQEDALADSAAEDTTVEDAIVGDTRTPQQHIWGNTQDSDFTGTLEDTFINLNTEQVATLTTLHLYTWPAASRANAILLKWDLAAIAGSTILSAQLELSQFTGAGIDYSTTVHRIINHNPDINQATGYTYDGTNSWTPNSCCHDDIPLAQADLSPAEDTVVLDLTNGYKSWQVTQMVQLWVDNPSSNYGMLVNSDANSESSEYRYFVSNEGNVSERPKLTITYTTQ